MTSTNTAIARNLRRARQYRGLSQTAIADMLGVSFQQVQKYECGANRISAASLYVLSRRLNVSVGWFFEGVEG